MVIHCELVECIKVGLNDCQHNLFWHIICIIILKITSCVEHFWLLNSVVTLLECIHFRLVYVQYGKGKAIPIAGNGCL
jgi:hypothetical protein